MTNNHSLPHRCDSRLRKAVIMEIIRQRQQTDEQVKLDAYKTRND